MANDVAAVMLFRTEFLHSLSERLRQSSHGIDVRLITSSPEAAIAAIREGDIDLLITGPAFIGDVVVLAEAFPGTGAVALITEDGTAQFPTSAHRHAVRIVTALNPGLDVALRAIAEVVGSATVPKPNTEVRWSASSISNRPPAVCVRDSVDEQIAELVALGLGDKDIAAQVFISHQTVRNRISRILGDSDLRNRTQLAVLILESRARKIDPFDRS